MKKLLLLFCILFTTSTFAKKPAYELTEESLGGKCFNLLYFISTVNNMYGMAYDGDKSLANADTRTSVAIGRMYDEGEYEQFEEKRAWKRERSLRGLYSQQELINIAREIRKQGLEGKLTLASAQYEKNFHKYLPECLRRIKSNPAMQGDNYHKKIDYSKQPK